MFKLRGPELSDRYDIAVIGSGFAGSLFAMIAYQLGRSVLLIERGKHPRVVIGESSTPLTNLLLEDITTRYDLPTLKPLGKWGSWQKAYPEVACGLKRGFTFYHHDLSEPRARRLDRGDQLLVAASPHDEIADTHWYRADLDHLLVREAQKLGVEYWDETELTEISQSDSGVMFGGKQKGQRVSFSAKFVVDASGPRGFLHRALGLKELELPDLPHTQALYSHFSGVGRLEHQAFAGGGEDPPYPVDDAAAHHVFDGGWLWVLQFNNGITSAGVAATDQFAAKWKLTDGAEAWQRIVQSIPALREQFASSNAERSFTHIPRLSFRSATIAGRNWTLLPSAAGFVDPLLSTGFPLTLLGIDRLAEIVAHDWDSPRFATSLQSYADKTDAELVTTSRLIASLYSTMATFPTFVALSLIYFAVASFSETARRLGKPHLARSFLLHDHPRFGPTLVQLCERARQVRTQAESDDLREDIMRAIEPFNVVGLGNRDRRNWYPVDPDDLLNSAKKVEASQDEILQLLRRCGFRLELKS